LDLITSPTASGATQTRRHDALITDRQVEHLYGLDLSTMQKEARQSDEGGLSVGDNAAF
jgi:hypothetical protein